MQDLTPLTYRSPKAEVRASPIQGLGLFAREPIGAGEIVAVKGGHVVSAGEWAVLTRELGPAEIQVAEDLVIAPVTSAERPGAMLYTNHSCEPNIAIQGQIVFVAMRDIAAGEELTHDWATTDDNDDTMACRCGRPSCRGTISGKDWMRPDLQAKYRGWFCWFLQRKIDLLGEAQPQASRTNMAMPWKRPQRETAARNRTAKPQARNRKRTHRHDHEESR